MTDDSASKPTRSGGQRMPRRSPFVRPSWGGALWRRWVSISDKWWSEWQDLRSEPLGIDFTPLLLTNNSACVLSLCTGQNAPLQMCDPAITRQTCPTKRDGSGFLVTWSRSAPVMGLCAMAKGSMVVSSRWSPHWQPRLERGEHRLSSPMALQSGQ
jgi:hypothetical protein